MTRTAFEMIHKYQQVIAIKGITIQGCHNFLNSNGFKANVSAEITSSENAWNEDESLEAKQIDANIPAFRDIARDTKKPSIP